jgi:hypothetical protein
MGQPKDGSLAWIVLVCKRNVVKACIGGIILFSSPLRAAASVLWGG